MILFLSLWMGVFKCLGVLIFLINYRVIGANNFVYSTCLVRDEEIIVDGVSPSYLFFLFFSIFSYFIYSNRFASELPSDDTKRVFMFFIAISYQVKNDIIPFVSWNIGLIMCSVNSMPQGVAIVSYSSFAKN